MGEDKKQRRLPVSFSALLLIGAVSVAATSAMLQARTDAPAPATVSQAAGARVERAAAPNATTAAQEPPLIEVLQAADALVKAGAIAPPPPAPTLEESLLAADALIRAGLLEPPPPPSLVEILRAVQQLDAAGALPVEPGSLRETLIAVQMLDAAGSLPSAPPPTDPAPAIPRDAGPRSVPEAPPPPAPPPSPTPVPEIIAAPPASGGAGWFDAAYAQAVWDGVNARRAAAGLPLVAPEPRLMRASENYAILMADTETFSHTGPDGSTLVTRVEAAGFPFTVQVGEILAMGSQGWTAASLVQAWMDSPGHREQILDGAYAYAGIGCYYADDSGAIMVRCVMNFAGA